MVTTSNFTLAAAQTRSRMVRIMIRICRATFRWSAFTNLQKVVTRSADQWPGLILDKLTVAATPVVDRQPGDFQDARQNRVASDEAQLVQPREAPARCPARIGTGPWHAASASMSASPPPEA